MNGEICCGTCKWHRKESDVAGWICTNPYSQFDSEWTEYGFCCEEYEDKLNRKIWDL